MNRGDDIFSEDAMDYVAQPGAVNCAKCRQHGERNVAYCGPEQRRQEDYWDGYGANPTVTRRFLLWHIKRRPTEDRKPCKVEGEHFHLWCQHCQFKWTEPLVKQ